jgi:hypothetical protein
MSIVKEQKKKREVLQKSRLPNMRRKKEKNVSRLAKSSKRLL